MLSPFALHLRTAVSEAEGAQGKLREASPYLLEYRCGILLPRCGIRMTGERDQDDGGRLMCFTNLRNTALEAVSKPVPWASGCDCFEEKGHDFSRAEKERTTPRALALGAHRRPSAAKAESVGLALRHE